MMCLGTTDLTHKFTEVK